AADTAAAGLEYGRDRLHRLLEHLERRLARAVADLVESSVDDALGGRALPGRHHAVDQLGDQARAVHGVGVQRTDGDLGTAGHATTPASRRTWNGPACGRRRPTSRARPGSPC